MSRTPKPSIQSTVKMIKVADKQQFVGISIQRYSICEKTACFCKILQNFLLMYRPIYYFLSIQDKFPQKRRLTSYSQNHGASEKLLCGLGYVWHDKSYCWDFPFNQLRLNTANLGGHCRSVQYRCSQWILSCAALESGCGSLLQWQNKSELPFTLCKTRNICVLEGTEAQLRRHCLCWEKTMNHSMWPESIYTCRWNETKDKKRSNFQPLPSNPVKYKQRHLSGVAVS